MHQSCCWSYDKYNSERSQYPVIYKNIINFETHLKSVVSNTVLNKYLIVDYSSLEIFISELKINSRNYPTRQTHLLDNFNSIF